MLLFASLVRTGEEGGGGDKIHDSNLCVRENQVLHEKRKISLAFPFFLSALWR